MCSGYRFSTSLPAGIQLERAMPAIATPQRYRKHKRASYRELSCRWDSRVQG